MPVDLPDGLVPTTAKSVTGSRCVQWPHAAKARLKNALNGARWADFRRAPISFQGQIRLCNGSKAFSSAAREIFRMRASTGSTS